MEAPSGGSAKPGPLGPDSLLVVSTTSRMLLGLSLPASMVPCIIFSEQAEEARTALFRSVEYAVNPSAEGHSLNEAAF